MSASIAFNRFGLGARPEDPAPRDPRGWVEDQIGRFVVRPPMIAAARTMAQVGAELQEYRQDRSQERRNRRDTPAAKDGMDSMSPARGAAAARKADEAGAKRQRDPGRMAMRRTARGSYEGAVAARMNAALDTASPFGERMTHFWANHFAISVKSAPSRPMAGPYEFEAIRPHVMGRFRDMLKSAEQHAGMIYYLNQGPSIGPDSDVGKRSAKKRGLNENLAREIMELHTLGVKGGYTQADVTEFARALTGWTITGITYDLYADPSQAGRFVFAAERHQPGDRTLMGQRFAAGGVEQGEAILDYLARHPATARHVATKLARHFAGDTPPPSLVDRLAKTFTESEGDLPTVYRALIASPEAWEARPLRFRTPWEWAVAGLRATGARTVDPGEATGLMDQLGQPVWQPGQPSGWDDLDATWANPDGLMRRVEAAERLAARTSGAVDAATLAPKLYPAAVSPATLEALRRAESPGQGMALMLVSPESVRR